MKICTACFHFYFFCTTNVFNKKLSNAPFPCGHSAYHWRNSCHIFHKKSQCLIAHCSCGGEDVCFSWRLEDNRCRNISVFRLIRMEQEGRKCEALDIIWRYWIELKDPLFLHSPPALVPLSPKFCTFLYFGLLTVSLLSFLWERFVPVFNVPSKISNMLAAVFTFLTPMKDICSTLAKYLSNLFPKIVQTCPHQYVCWASSISSWTNFFGQFTLWKNCLWAILQWHALCIKLVVTLVT